MNGTRGSADVQAQAMQIVKIALSKEQQTALEKLTGEKLSELRIAVEDLIDLADLVTN